jgi:hypothetical protein
MHAFEAWMEPKRRPTPQGAPVVVKRVAIEHGIERAERLPLPRLSRSQLEDVLDWEWSVRSLRERP